MTAVLLWIIIKILQAHLGRFDENFKIQDLQAKGRENYRLAITKTERQRFFG